MAQRAAYYRLPSLDLESPVVGTQIEFELVGISQLPKTELAVLALARTTLVIRIHRCVESAATDCPWPRLFGEVAGVHHGMAHWTGLFDAELDRLDREWAFRGVAPHHRQQAALDELERGGELTRLLVEMEQLQHNRDLVNGGVLRKLSLIESWYSRHYGEQAVQYVGPIGTVPFMFRGAVVGLVVPLRLGNPGIDQVRLEGIPPAMSDLLQNDHNALAAIQTLLQFGLRNYEAMESFSSRWRSRHATEGVQLFCVAIENVESCVSACLARRPKDTAFWAQQAAEKALKGFLKHHGERAPRTHDLGLLFASACSLEAGLAGLDRYLPDVNFPMDVRYQQSVSTEAGVRACKSAIHLVGNIASGLVPR